MSTSSTNSDVSPFRRLMAHVRMPLYRNAYALVLSSGIMSGLGFVYWIFAARNYSTETVGLNSVAISTMLFLSYISQLNLGSALNRFVPNAGRATARLVLRSYLASSLLALTVSLIFVLGIDIWTPALGFLRSRPLLVTWFTLATVGWSVFALQDDVLVGLRQATWVPIENTVFALAKIALLIGFASILPAYGIFASWSLPAVFLVLPTNFLIFRFLIPQHSRLSGDREMNIASKQITGYIAADYLGSIMWHASTSLLPILVTERVGPTANAYFYLSWTITYALYLVSINMGMSLTAEGAADQKNLPTYSLRVFVQAARLLVPVVTIIVLGAPYILLLFGRSYAEEGTTVLRVLALSALPNIVVSLAISILRVQRRVGMIVLLLGTLSVLVLSLSYLLLDLYGIVGVGMAVLLAQTAVAAAVVCILFRRGGASYLDVSILSHPLGLYRTLRWQWTRRRFLAGARRAAPAILSKIAALPDMPPPDRWSVQRLMETSEDTAVITLGTRGHPSAVILKLPQTESAVHRLRWQAEVLTTLHADPRLDGWSGLLPKVLAEGQAAGQAYTVESVVPGINACTVLSNPESCARMQAAAAAGIGELHRRTGVLTKVNADMIERWVNKPLRIIRATKGMGMDTPQREKSLGLLLNELHDALEGRTVTVSWIHGDFDPGNILVTPDGATLTGIVDWELGTAADLPQFDLLFLLLFTRVLVRHCDLGDVVQEFLTGVEWSSHERTLLDTMRSGLPGDPIEVRTLVLLCWLRHVADTFLRSSRYSHHWLWVAKNVTQVLQYI